MSTHNTANKSNYDQGGRLTPDELARELNMKAELAARSRADERLIGRRQAPAGAPGDSPRRSAPEE
jgi:hypothetical protein